MIPYKTDTEISSYLIFPRFLIPLDLSNDAKRSLSVDYELSVRNRKGLKTFDFKKNGANGTTLVAALAVKEPFDMLCVHSNGEVECINTESLFIEPRLSAGKPYVLGILGDSLAKVYKKL